MKVLNFVTLYAVDFLLAFGIAYFASDGEKLMAFFGTLAILWLVPLAFSAWHLVRFWIAYHLYMRENMVRYYLAEFHRTSFPDPSAFFDWDIYAAHVVEDPYTDDLARSKAAFIQGEHATFRSTAPFTMGVAVGLALQKAMDSYSPHPSNYSPHSKNL